MSEGRGRDLRRYAAGTQVRLGVGAALILTLVGGGIIYLFYGPRAALGALACLLVMLIPVALIALWLWGLERIVRRAGDG